MIDRGPFVRFVWTVAADDALDHHPDDGRRPGWSDATERGWLRVERQVTVPLRPVDSAIFLIRTYLYPLESLTLEQRRTLSIALREMPEEIAAYKGLLANRLRRFGVRLGAGERLDHLPVLEQLELVGDRVTVRIGRRGPLEVDLSGRDIRTRT